MTTKRRKTAKPKQAAATREPYAFAAAGYLNPDPGGGIKTDAGGRPVTDAGGRPVVKDK